MTPRSRQSARIAAVAAEWWLDEGAHAGPEHLDPEYVAAFDRKSPTDWLATAESLSGLGVGSQSTVIDLGAGTGTFALTVSPHVGRVVAVDPSPAMIAVMRARGINAVQGGFLTYEHETRTHRTLHVLVAARTDSRPRRFRDHRPVVQ
jgi:SAM-dependent methyltransferase